MALARVHTWVAGEVLLASDLNAEFNNVLTNARSLISPLTASLDMDGFELIMDADADSSLTADTDDKLDVRLGGVDLFIFNGATASCVNGLSFFGTATGSNAYIRANGTDANTAITLKDTNGNEVLITASVASAVNEVTLTAAATGVAPSITATGETNVGLLIAPKGTGNVEVRNFVIGLCEGRLTLTTATPVTTSDVTAAETVYFAPYRGNRIALFDGTDKWKVFAFTELSIDVPDATQMQDVFVYDNAGTPALELTTWSSETARATALTTQNGVLVKTGATTRRYVGSFYSTTAGNGQTEDSFAKRYVWNYYNRVDRPMRVTSATDNYNYTTATIRQAEASTANQLDLVIGVSEDPVTARLLALVSSSGAETAVGVGIGLDSTSAFASGCIGGLVESPAANYSFAVTSSWRGFPGVGRHFLAWLEYSQAAGTTTWYGDAGAPTLNQGGIHGEVLG